VQKVGRTARLRKNWHALGREGTDIGVGSPLGGRTGIRVAQPLFDEAKKDGWIVISMKNDWKRIFAFE
jgi:hypothetical protein